MNTLIVITDIVEKLILVLLLGLSVWSGAIMIDRRKYFRALAETFELKSLKSLLQGSSKDAVGSQLEKSPNSLVRLLSLSVLGSTSAQAVDRKFNAEAKELRRDMEKGLAVLATLGANAPFIGLFGTVLGIIRAFAFLGSQAGSAAVMSGVSQALYATAVGLLVAIPAVVAFNLFSKKVKDSLQQAESLKDLYVAQFLSKDQ
ncbi:MAG: MotA/TolQ/ExbB proton channel family protein [Pseudobdellovibrionaceae bacterium]|jgi:biopolymer transport protein ExbB/TolQ